nr:hypothetical protein [Tanacetum cinerariifolium]
MPEDPYAPPSPDYVPGPKHADDEIVAEDRPYAEDASPNAQSPEYVPESDLEAHPEDDDDEDPEDDPVDHPADGGDDGDDEDGSSEDDEDDDMDIEADEEEEHPAHADSVVVASTSADQAPSAEETEPFETNESAATPPPHPAYRMTARISIPAPVPKPAWSDSKIVRLLAIPDVGLMVDYGFVDTIDREIMRDPEREVGYGIIDSWDEIVEALQGAPVSTDTELGGYMGEFETRVRQDTDEIYMREIMRDPEREVGYRIIDSWDEIVEALQGAPVSTDTELGGYMGEFETRVRQDTDEIYMRLDDEQTERHLLAGQLNMLFRDRRAHAYTRHLMETEARLSREAWVMSLRTTILGQMTEIRELHVADRRRQTVISKMLGADHRRSTEIIELRTALQGQVTALQG